MTLKITVVRLVTGQKPEDKTSDCKALYKVVNLTILIMEAPVLILLSKEIFGRVPRIIVGRVQEYRAAVWTTESPKLLAK